MGIDGGWFRLYEPKEGSRKGFRGGVSFFYDHFAIRVGINKLENQTEFTPTLQYSNNYKNHNYTIEYTRQNALFYTYKVCTHDQKITADHLSISDYISFTEQRNLWANITLNHYDVVDDIETIAQFDWRFYYDTIWLDKLWYDVALEGYYTFNTQENSCFYSPKFNDATLIRLDPDYRWSKYLKVKAMIAAGYSLEAKQFLYKYGAWIYGDPLNNLSYTLGCMQSNSAKTGFSGDGYYYRECKAQLGYKW